MGGFAWCCWLLSLDCVIVLLSFVILGITGSQLLEDTLYVHAYTIGIIKIFGNIITLLRGKDKSQNMGVCLHRLLLNKN